MKEVVERAAHDLYGNRATFVHNDDYASTNTAVSLNRALRDIDSDFILVNGDVLFDQGILENLLRRPSPNCLAVDAEATLDGEEVKVIVRDGRVERVGKDIDPTASLGEAIGLNKIGRNLVPELVRVFDRLEAGGEFGHYFEKGIDEICRGAGNAGRSFGVSLTGGRPWIEIDTIEDYEHARRDIAPKLGR